MRSTRPIGAAYVDVDGLLANSFTRSDGSAGTYEAPVRLLYPAAQKSCTGVGLEDLANGFLYNFGVHDDFWNLHYARRVLTDDFLMRRGVTYASPTWDKKAIDHLGRGHLEHREDGLRVVQDVAAWLRDPSSVTVVGVEAPHSVIASPDEKCGWPMPMSHLWRSSSQAHGPDCAVRA